MSEDSAAIRVDEKTLLQDALSPEAVAAYLLNNPNFFNGRDDILVEMELPHRAGSAVSLVERQVSLLRERNIDSRHRLSHLLGNARDNDKLFQRTRELVLSILESASLADLTKRVESGIRSEFGADHCRLVLLDGHGRQWHGKVNRMDADQAAEQLSGIMRQTKPMVGALRPQEYALLFGDTAPAIKSAAVATVRRQGVIALLALGSHKSDRFDAAMGTIFLEFVSEVLGRLLPRLAQSN